MLAIRSLFAAFLLCVFAASAQAQPFDEAAPDVRDAAALTVLQKEAGVVMLYAQGLCCGSCAIGIRKKISPLPFVDRSRFSDGVSLDPEHQLVTIAIKKGETPDPKALATAIVDAGYDPVSLHTLKEGALATVSIVPAKK